MTMINIILHLIQKQQEEIKLLKDQKECVINEYGETIENKDKIIDEIIQEYEYNARINLKNFCDEEMRKDKCIQDCRTCIKQYFEKKVEEK